MTERFIVDGDGKYWDETGNKSVTVKVDHLSRLVEGFNRKNKQLSNSKTESLKKENELLKQKYLKLEHRHSLLHDECLDLECERDWLKKDVELLEKENEALKKRNDNQYNQLNELLQLIEAKDWETLTAMDNQMKEDEERLKREWACYE